jgi:O-antigen biosynthesis protein WbqP
MKKNTSNVANHLLKNPDQYLLKIGKFIRKTSLDELSNLINIIMGEKVFLVRDSFFQLALQLHLHYL